MHGEEILVQNDALQMHCVEILVQNDALQMHCGCTAWKSLYKTMHGGCVKGYVRARDMKASMPARPMAACVSWHSRTDRTNEKNIKNEIGPE